MELKELEQKFREEFREFEERETVILSLTPITAWSVFAALQLACKHPGFEGKVRQLAEHTARRMEDLIALTPAMKEVATRGWKS